jgi:hypothetical protein
MKTINRLFIVLCLAVLGGCYEAPRPPQSGREPTIDEQRRLANEEWFRQNTQRSRAFPAPFPEPSPTPTPPPSQFPR